MVWTCLLALKLLHNSEGKPAYLLSGGTLGIHVVCARQTFADGMNEGFAAAKAAGGYPGFSEEDWGQVAAERVCRGWGRHRGPWSPPPKGRKSAHTRDLSEALPAHPFSQSYLKINGVSGEGRANGRHRS